MKQTLLFRNFLASFFLLVCSGVFAQLTDFTLNVTAVNESCTANGVLNFTASNTTAGATILYRIYHLPDMATPIVVTSLNTFTGLTAGTYRVVATQSLGSQSNTQQQDATITNVISALTYTLTGQKVVCGNDGKITVNVTQGNVVSYEIFVGPVIRPLQASNVFDLLPTGIYQIRVFDNCGEGVVQNYTVTANNTAFVLQNHNYGIVDCNTIKTYNVLGTPTTANSEIAYPLTLQFTVIPPSGPVIQFTQTNVMGSSPNLITVEQDIPLYYNQNYSYSIIITDRCGHVLNTGPLSVFVKLELEAALDSISCAESILNLSAAYFMQSYTVSFLSAPAGFNPVASNPSHPGPFTGLATYTNLPFGQYVIRVTDTCGRTDTQTVFVSPPPVDMLIVQQTPGCGVGNGSAAIFYNNQTHVVAASIVAAPSGYPYPLPHAVSVGNESPIFMLPTLPEGLYTVNVSNVCGGQDQVSFEIVGYHITSNSVSIVERCNSFDVVLIHQSNAQTFMRFWLQKLNPVTGQWGHPATGNGPAGPPDTANALQLQNNFTNSNLSFTGTFRVVKTFITYNDMPNPTYQTCVDVLYDFEYDGQPEIIDVYSFACANNLLDVIVVADGIAPLNYKITTKNDQPFIINNGTSPIFLALEPATYNFQVQDNCGNILNSLYDISQPVSFSITPQNVCEGQTASLTVPNFSFLNYQWWQGDNTATVLSTSNVLQFPNFNPVTQGGIYHVRINYPNPNSCIDVVLDYQVPVNSTLPNAGNDNSTSYCGSPGMLDLSTLLTGNFDFGGNWQEITSSGVLTDNIWNAINVDAGNYQFRYTVNGLCNASDESIVNIQINPIPETPAAFLEQAICDGGNLYLLATNVPGNYEWSGPNGFVSNLQNPVIENVSALQNGTYTVKAIAGGCESGVSSVNVAVSPLPLFTLAGDCINNQYTITASVTDQTIDPATLVFSWNGPDNYNDSGNPVTITGGKRGIYTATATTPDGCAATSQITVATTMCSIPTGVSPNDDTRNDTFDLAGFDVLKFKVYNRYGRMVYEQDNYTNQWHGQDFNGNILPDATYYYYIRLFTGEERTGWVYVTK
jgi:gliding motility-associated-like protein